MQSAYRAWLCLTLGLLCGSFQTSVLRSQSADAASEIRLKGIVVINDVKKTLLEISTPDATNKYQATPILREGQRFADFEVVAINEKTERVKIQRAGVETTLSFENPTNSGSAESEAPKPLRLEAASELQVLDAYAELAHRNVLRPSALPRGTFNVKTEGPVSSKDGLQILDAALLEQGIVMTSVGDRFVFATTAAMAKNLPSLPPPVSGNENEHIKPGEIVFLNVPVLDFFGVYAEYIGKTAEKSQKGIPSAFFSFKNQTPLTRIEAVYAMNATLALNGLRAEVTDDKVRLVPANSPHR